MFEVEAGPSTFMLVFRFPDESIGNKSKFPASRIEADVAHLDQSILHMRRDDLQVVNILASQLQHTSSPCCEALRVTYSCAVRQLPGLSLFQMIRISEAKRLTLLMSAIMIAPPVPLPFASNQS
jgi:hypothetical protein